MDFSNSLLMCWGKYVVNTNTYPIAYTQFVRIVASGEYSWQTYDNRIMSTTLTTFYCCLNHQNETCTHYLSIGI